MAINTLLAIYDKTGVQQGGFQDLKAFFGGLGISGDLTDPRVIYDQVDGRFILSIAELDFTNFTNGHVFLAVSQTSDPTGAWNKFAINFMGRNPANTANTFPDFPGLGLGPNAVYLTSNQFVLNAQCLGQNATEPCYFSDAWIKVIGLPELLSGNPSLNITTFKNIHTASSQLAFSIQPALTYGSPSAEFLVAASFAQDPGNVLDLFSINTSGAPTLSSADLTVPQFTMPPDVRQPGSSQTIITDDFRTLNAVWANNSLWVGQNAGYGADVAAQWYEIQLSDLASATLVQSGFELGALDAYYPALSVKADGTVGMAFTTSSPAMPASAAFTARVPGDPLGTMRSYAVYRQGSGPYDEPTENRWGDYSGISVDPDGSSFWTIAEYAGSPDPHFGTAIAQMTSPPSLAVWPPIQSFDLTKVGQTSPPKSVTFQNNGTAAITLGTVQKGGPSAGDFAITTDLCSGVSLSASQSCTVTLVFSPSQQTYESAYLGVSGGSGSVYATIDGFGLPPDLVQLSPSSIVFPPTVQQTSSAPQVLTITNAASYSLTNFSISLGGPFTQTNNCGSTLALGASCQVSIVFHPTSATTFTSYLYLSVGQPLNGVSVSGTGVTGPAAVLCPPSLDFGNQVSGTSSSSQPVVLTNAGSAQLTITSISASGDFTETDDCVGSLPTRASCTIQVTFSPSGPGPLSGQLSIYDDAPGSPQAVGLSGNGTIAGLLLPSLDPLTDVAEQLNTAAVTPDLRHRVLNAERPISFEANRGQFAPEVQYVAHLPRYALAITRRGLLLHFGSASTPSARPAPALPNTAQISIALVGTQPGSRAIAVDRDPATTNYFIGRDPSQWRTSVPTYKRVKWQGIYPGVDLVYYGTERQLEYDFVVRPGADPNRIRLKFDRDSRLSVSPDGDLLVSSISGAVRLHKPVVYQPAADTEVSTEASHDARLYREGRWVLRGSSAATFKLGSYDRRRELVIDPVLSFSTYLGGSTGEIANAIALDPSGNIYVAGFTYSNDFPVTANAFSKTCNSTQFPCYPSNASYDGFVAKFTPDGSHLLYATYLGGTRFATELRGIAVDSAGDAFVTGTTSSSDYPTTANAFDTTLGAAFVTKLDPTGSSLLYSTLLGGHAQSSPPDSGNAIAVNSQGDAYVAGVTTAPDFPLTPGAFVTAPPTALRSHAFLTSVNPTGTGLVYSTYIGGSGNDAANAVAVDSSGNAYVTGQAQSLDFSVTSGAFQTGSYGSDAFVAKFAPSGSVIYSTLLGGEPVRNSGYQSNVGKGIAIDGSGAAFVTGQNVEAGFPVTPGAFSTAQNLQYNAFLAKLHPQGCALTYATYTGADDSRGIALDAAGNVYVAGTLGSNVGVPLPSSPQVPGVNAVQPALGGAYTLVSEFDPSGATLLFSTPFGGSFFDWPNAIALDPAGNIFIAGKSSSQDMPNLNALQPECRSCAYQAFPNETAFLAKIDPTQAAAGVTLTRTELTFASIPANASFAETQVLGLMNNQAVPLNIQSVSVSGAGYSIGANACQGSVMPSAGCAISLKFQPADGGPIPGLLTITDDGPGSPRQVLLNGTGSADFSLSQGVYLMGGSPLKGTDSVNFGVNLQGVPGTTLPGGLVQLTCAGVAPATCTFNPPAIPANGGSTLTVTNLSAVTGDSFTFTILGTLGSQTASANETILFGDFSLTIPQSSSTVTAGQKATYQINGDAINTGAIVNFSCSGLPQYASCSFSPSALTLTSGISGTSSTMLTVSTSQVVVGSLHRFPRRPAGTGRSRFWAGAAGVGVLAVVFLLGPSKRRHGTAMLLLMLSVLFFVSCGGGSSSGGTPPPPPPPQYTTKTTPPGTYTITVNAQAGILQHTSQVTLVVN